MTNGEIRSEVVGTVWRIERSVGEHVEAGDVVLILESMKMEIPVEAPSPGTITKLLVEENASVDDGTPLFGIES